MQYNAREGTPNLLDEGRRSVKAPRGGAGRYRLQPAPFLLLKRLCASPPYTILSYRDLTAEFWPGSEVDDKTAQRNLSWYVSIINKGLTSVGQPYAAKAVRGQGIELIVLPDAVPA